MESDPRDVDGDKLVTGAGRVVRLRAFCGRFDDLAGSAHADAIVRRQVHLIIVAAPEPRQHEAAHFVRYFKFFPLAGLALVMKNVATNRRATVVAVLPLHVDRITAGAGRVQ